MRYVSLFTISLLVLSSCNRNELDIDVSGVTTRPLRVERLEKDLFSLNSGNIDAKTPELQKRYGIYYDHYLTFLNRNGSRDLMYKTTVLPFVNDHDTREAYSYITQLYPDQKIHELAAEADQCVKRFHYHFPKRPLPTKLITVMTGWNYYAAYQDNALIISLDMYLGDTAKFYQMLRMPQYQAKKMNDHYLLPDLMRAWMLTEFDNASPVNTLLNHTVFYGKLYYAINALLPTSEDSLLIGYSSKQMTYCKSYEKKLWSYFAEKNRLYENNLQNVRELTSDGPFTGVISKECPPRIAMWVGWQIVKSYMKNNKDVTLEQLMAEEDAGKILNKSRYRP